MTECIDPDCKNGKHSACLGWTFDEDTDSTTDCACVCHLVD